jgi:hypothetical protein
MKNLEMVEMGSNKKRGGEESKTPSYHHFDD